MKYRSDINIGLSRDQFELLLEVVEIGRWVVCSGQQCRDQAYRDAVDELGQQLLMYGLEFGFAGSVFANEDDGHMGHIAFEDQECRAWWALKDYEEEKFWLDLTSHLALVMSRREMGDVAWGRMAEMQKCDHLCDCEDRIRDAFETHGLQCLTMTSAVSAG